MVRFLWGGLALKSGLHAVLGWHQSSVTASLAHRDRVVAADLCVAKGGGRGHNLCVGGGGRDLQGLRGRIWGLGLYGGEAGV